MNTLRLLIVEDAKQDLEILRDAVDDYTRDKQQDIDLVECKTLDEALRELDNSFDGAIIDLKLADQGDEGSQIVEVIGKSFFRIPIAILTGNPSNWDDSLKEKIMLIDDKVFIKGETEYDELQKLLHRFWDIYNTGLTRIMGGRGEIEKNLSQVFLNNLQPHLQTWVAYGEKDSERTEKALLRYTLNHLLQLLEEEEERSFPEEVFPEEVYLYPPVLNRITTGSIVTADDKWFAVLSPACDLIPRNDKFKPGHRILLAGIESEDEIVGKGKVKSSGFGQLRDNRLPYYHWLPPTKFFEGGFLDFRNLRTLTNEEFDKKFEKPSIQISPFFVKDIVARFSSFYARQGQPDIDEGAKKALIDSLKEKDAAQ